MHDGSLATLWDVMDHYNKGGVANPFLDGGMQRLGLTEPEIDDLVAFLFALTDARFDEVQPARSWRGRRELQGQAAGARHRGRAGQEGQPGRPRAQPGPDVKNPAELGVYGAETSVKSAAK